MGTVHHHLVPNGFPPAPLQAAAASHSSFEKTTGGIADGNITDASIDLRDVYQIDSVSTEDLGPIEYAMSVIDAAPASPIAWSIGNALCLRKITKYCSRLGASNPLYGRSLEAEVDLAVNQYNMRNESRPESARSLLKPTLSGSRIPCSADEVLACLTSYAPVIAHIRMYESFLTTKDLSDRIPTPRADEKCIGSHVIVIMGYDPARKHAWLFRTSFGIEWGCLGYASLSSEYLFESNAFIDAWSIRGDDASSQQAAPAGSTPSATNLEATSAVGRWDTSSCPLTESEGCVSVATCSAPDEQAAIASPCCDPYTDAVFDSAAAVAEFHSCEHPLDTAEISPSHLVAQMT